MSLMNFEYKSDYVKHLINTLKIKENVTLVTYKDIILELLDYDENDDIFYEDFKEIKLTESNEYIMVYKTDEEREKISLFINPIKYDSEGNIAQILRNDILILDSEIVNMEDIRRSNCQEFDLISYNLDNIEDKCYSEEDCEDCQNKCDAYYQCKREECDFIDNEKNREIVDNYREFLYEIVSNIMDKLQEQCIECQFNTIWNLVNNMIELGFLCGKEPVENELEDLKDKLRELTDKMIEEDNPKNTITINVEKAKNDLLEVQEYIEKIYNNLDKYNMI